MNDNVNVQEQDPVDVVTDDVDFEDTAANGPTADVDVVLNDLEQMADDFFAHVQKIRMLQENGFFKYVSKSTRNEALTISMLEQVKALEETAKVAFRSLKKVKRERVPDELVDKLLISSVTPAMLRLR